jgi:hypothetical protein
MHLSPRQPARHAHSRTALLLGALLAPALPAAAQTLNLYPSKFEINQAVPMVTTNLVGGRSTFVRVSVRVTGAASLPVPVDGVLHVSANGAEIPGSPFFSDNGPFPVQPGVSMSVENATLNFIVLPPVSSNVVLTVDINPPGPNFVPEVNLADNSLSTASLNFGLQAVPEMQYAPIDYRPTGGTVPNLPDPFLIEPGMGDNFIQGIYPAPDWDFRRTDAPSKLWTSSLSGTGTALLSSLQVDINLMLPKPDFLYGFVPGPLPGYNGQAYINGNVSMGNTELIRYQRTIAHELGHNFGLQHNSITTNVVGVDVEHHLNLTQGLPQIKATTLKDIMYAGLLTQEAWVWPSNYSFFYNHSVFNASDGLAADAGQAPRLLVAGAWNPSTGAVTLHDVLTLPAAAPSAAASPAAADLLLRAYAGGVLVQELPVDASGSSDECGGCRDGADSDVPPTDVAFSAVLELPGSAIDRLVIAQAGPRAVSGLALQRSASAPQAELALPAGNSLGAGPLAVEWEAQDADGDALTFYLRYSPDGERFAPVLTSTKATQAQLDAAQLPAPVDGQAFFELLASDGLNTTVVRTAKLSAPAADGVVGNAPWVTIYAPDSGFTYWKGANVILHSSGWDLEDKALTGGDIAWSSNVDGALGTGRLLAVSGLSVGPHVITVTATDGAGNPSVDSATITVLDRGLPGGGGTTCQADLGFGGPGSAALSLCGGDLSTGTSADLELSGGPPSATGALLAGLVNSPTPFKGGLLVPFPASIFVPVVLDIDGGLVVGGVPGGGGPFSLFIQAVLADGGQPQGVGLSNAVQADFLP